MYAKIIDGVFTIAPKKINRIIGGQEYTTFNPTGEMLAEQGWKPVTETAHEEAPAGYEYRPVYTDAGDTILQSWELTERELSADEAMEYLFGGGDG